MAINESRKLFITERIFTRQNIQSLAKVIANQTTLPSTPKTPEYLLQFTLTIIQPLAAKISLCLLMNHLFSPEILNE